MHRARREYAAALKVEAALAERRRLANLKQNQGTPIEVLTSTPRVDEGKARDRAAERINVGWQKAERAAAPGN